MVFRPMMFTGTHPPHPQNTHTLILILLILLTLLLILLLFLLLIHSYSYYSYTYYSYSYYSYYYYSYYSYTHTQTTHTLILILLILIHILLIHTSEMLSHPLPPQNCEVAQLWLLIKMNCTFAPACVHSYLHCISFASLCMVHICTCVRAQFHTCTISQFLSHATLRMGRGGEGFV
jgi:uncharacterized membrane protein